MLALRSLPARLSKPALLVWRGNATVAASSPGSSSPTPPPPALTPKSTPKLKAALAARTELAPLPSSEASSPEVAPVKTQGRRKGTPRDRPKIYASKPRKYNRPIASGIIPAYDLALNVLEQDSNVLKEEAMALQVEINAKEAAVQELKAKAGDAEATAEARKLDEELEKMRERHNILQVQSEINLPLVRWKVSNAMADFSIPVHRHLVEQRWRKEGDLDLLMERLYQMKVVPDVLPELYPSVDVHVVVRNTLSLIKKTEKARGKVEPGAFLNPYQTIPPPDIYATVYHPEQRLYTLLLVDPDVPDEENGTFTTFLHCLKPNVPLSAGQHKILGLSDHTRYIPPHPQEGTPYHRYVLLLLPQPPLGASTYTYNAAARAGLSKSASVKLDIPVVSKEERLGFDVREFTNRWGLNVVKGGGAHMWREIWNSNVSRIYKDIFKRPEPRYGRPRKVDPYAEVKQTKRYIS